MQIAYRVLGSVALALFPGMALAGPVTYSGTLGGTAIVVEFTDDPARPGGPLAGRYFYRSKGVDIPLQAKSRKGGRFELAEEAACGADKCGEGQPTPVAATWKLSSSDKGKTLEGTWTGKKPLPLKLVRVGEREGSGAENPYGLYSDTDMAVFANGDDIAMENMPYDHLRLDVPPVEGEKAGWPDASYRYVTDPRTKFQRPRIVEVAGGISVDKANETLKQRHWRDSLAALACSALQYRGFHSDPPIDSMADGTLGGYDETTAEVTALTPLLMSWREAGSTFCGGAHPHNYSNGFTMDVATGNLLTLGDIFADTADGRPGPALLAFVKETREKPTDQADIDFEAECGTEDLLAEYLAASFRREGDALNVVFGLQGLPHVITACGDDLLELPVAEVQSLLKPEFKGLAGL